MGEKSTLPSGVEINGKKLRIWFMYEGKRCREPMNLPVSPANIRAAARFRAQLVAQIDAGVFDYGIAFPKSKHGKVTQFKELARLWLESRRPEVKKSSFVKYSQITEQLWIPRLGELDVRYIKTTTLLDAISQTDWEKLSPKRWNDCLIPLRGVFALAMQDRLIDSDPTTSLKNRKPRPEPADPFTLPEAKLMIDLLRDYGPEVSNMYEVLFFTGMRPGELIALKWKDVDLKNGTIDVVSTKCCGVIDLPKNGEIRTHDCVSRVIDVLRLQYQFTGEEEFVFKHPNLGAAFHETRPLRETWWDKVMVDSGLRLRTLYQTRHTYATLGIMAGANPYWLAEQMGTSPELIFKTYGKWLKQIGNSGEKIRYERMLETSPIAEL
jgi:integrase